MDVEKGVQKAVILLSLLGAAGFIVLIWLMIFGNLSGNLGFPDISNSTSNETGAFLNFSAYTVASATQPGFSNFVVTEARNSTDGVVIAPGNYTVDSTAGTVINASTTIWTAVDLDYTFSQDSYAEVQSDKNINNNIDGFIIFSGFSGTFFTIVAVVLLITMFLGLISLALMIVNKVKGGGKKGGFSGY